MKLSLKIKKFVFTFFSVFLILTPSFAETFSSASLSEAIAGHRSKVMEFEFIRQEALKLGVRAWLFGGTAAGYAHYVKWDLRRKKGDHRYQPDRFDYDYTNIFRSTQDMDIVIDGTEHQAAQLETALLSKFPHMQGSKSVWEVRLLTADRGDKQALLNNPDFLNQHTDSNSTGMIELTESREAVVRDLRDWKSADPFFLRDIFEDKIHYYHSSLHTSTTFYRQGRNPPIISVIRLLTKAFQYELSLRPEDLKIVSQVIAQFDPYQARTSSYVLMWLEKNGPKMIQNAVNIEYAWNTLDRLGLRQKLMLLKGDTTQEQSLAWWMSKEPLRNKKVGLNGGRTARELGIQIVAHETKNFLAYESITRAHTGEPNVLISRKGFSGEEAVYGDGFYTALGREGARGSGLTIRFRVSPTAREGYDFNRVGDYIIFLNKAALEVIPEQISVDIVGYFNILVSGSINPGDMALFEKLKRRMSRQALTADPEQYNAVKKIVLNVLSKSHPDWRIAEEWFSIFSSRVDLEIFKAVTKKIIEEAIPGQPVFRGEFALEVLRNPLWVKHPEIVKYIVESKNAEILAMFLLVKLNSNSIDSSYKKALKAWKVVSTPENFYRTREIIDHVFATFYIIARYESAKNPGLKGTVSLFAPQLGYTFGRRLLGQGSGPFGLSVALIEWAKQLKVDDFPVLPENARIGLTGHILEVFNRYGNLAKHPNGFELFKTYILVTKKYGVRQYALNSSVFEGNNRPQSMNFYVRELLNQPGASENFIPLLEDMDSNNKLILRLALEKKKSATSDGPSCRGLFKD